MKKLISALLIAALMLACCACGQPLAGGFRELETVGEKHYSVICRSGDRLAPVIHAAMNQLAASGMLASVSARWLGKDVITLDGDRNALADIPAEERSIDRTLIVGVEGGFNPMAFERGGELVGMSVEIGEQLGALLGCPVVFQSIAPAEVGAQLSSGNVDCAVGFDASLVDSGKYDIGDSYMDSDIVVAVRSDSEVSKLSDLKEQRIGIVDDPSVQKAVKASEKVTKYASGATVCISSDRCISALDNGWCAAVAMDRLQLVFLDSE